MHTNDTCGTVHILEGANKEIRSLEAFLVVEIILKNVEANIDLLVDFLSSMKQWYFVTKIVLTYCEKKLF
jgi:hypothetical protein